MQLYYRAEEHELPENIYLIANAHWESHTFEIPALLDQNWFRFVDTTREAPQEIAELGKEERLPDEKHYLVGPRSVVVLIGKA
jgi:glycogen operon protein